MNPKIVFCRISKQPTEMFDKLPMVSVMYEDGTEEDLFSYYPDEIYFSESEFIGLTKEQAKSLYHIRDVAFLKS
jgi:hypothetical protein